MAQDCAGSLQVCAMRVCELDGAGVPNPGSGNVYVTNQLIRLTITPVIAEGDDFEVKNGCGEVCVQFRDCDRLRRLDLEMELCTPDPELTALLVPGDILSIGAEVVGYQYPELGTGSCPNGVGLECWTKAITNGKLDPERPYWRWVFGRTFWQHAPRTLENGPLANVFTGFANENPNFFNGPANDWSFDSDRVLQYARATSIPATSCGAASLAAS